eukprot:5446002-Pleurochrysis_carterae.AAC.2
MQNVLAASSIGANEPRFGVMTSCRLDRGVCLVERLTDCDLLRPRLKRAAGQMHSAPRAHDSAPSSLLLPHFEQGRRLQSRALQPHTHA